MGIENFHDKLVGGQYRLGKILGKGAMSVVYRARQESLDRDVAVKVLSMALLEDPNYLERFKREAKTIASLEHPHIVPLYDYGAEGDITYVVMRLLPGGTLDERLKRRYTHDEPPMSLAEIADFLAKLASALDYAHSRGIVHRDIKPGNILFDPHNSPVLVDFGIVKIMGDTAAELTRSGMLPGTPRFMSPEQWSGEPITPAVDQYALAGITYLMVTGQEPFQGNIKELMKQHLSYMPSPVHTVRSDAPPALSSVLNKALAKNPTDRYPSVSDFAAAFADAGTEGTPISTEEYLVPESPKRTYTFDSDTTTHLDQPPAPPRKDYEMETVFAMRTGEVQIPQMVAAAKASPPPPASPSKVHEETTPDFRVPPPPAPPRRTARGRLPLWAGLLMLAMIAAIAGLLVALASGGDSDDESEGSTQEVVEAQHTQTALVAEIAGLAALANDGGTANAAQVASLEFQLTHAAETIDAALQNQTAAQASLVAIQSFATRSRMYDMATAVVFGATQTQVGVRESDLMQTATEISVFFANQTATETIRLQATPTVTSSPTATSTARPSPTATTTATPTLTPPAAATPTPLPTTPAVTVTPTLDTLSVLMPRPQDSTRFLAQGIITQPNIPQLVLLDTFVLPERLITGLAFVPNQADLHFLTDRGYRYKWNTETTEVIAPADGDTELGDARFESALTFLPTNAESETIGYRNGSLEIFTANAAPPTVVEGLFGEGAILRLIFSADGQSVFAAGVGSNSLIRITLEGIQEPLDTGHTLPLLTFDLSRDGKWLATLTETELFLWDAPSRQIHLIPTATLGPESTPEQSAFTTLAFSPNGRYLAVGRRSGWIGIWDLSLPDNRPQRVLNAFPATPVNALVFSHDGQILVSAQGDQIHFWETAVAPPPAEPLPPDTEPLVTLRGHTAEVRWLVFNTIGTLLASAGDDGRVLLWGQPPCVGTVGASPISLYVSPRSTQPVALETLPPRIGVNGKLQEGSVEWRRLGNGLWVRAPELALGGECRSLMTYTFDQ